MENNGEGTIFKSFVPTDYCILLVALVLNFPFLFFGYGADCDTYLSLDAGRNVLAGKPYQPSRNPGYLPDEVSWAVLGGVGGPILGNSVTLAFVILTVAAFLQACIDFQVPHRHLLGFILILHPIFWENANCTMDYFWALGPLLISIVLLRRGHFFWVAWLWTWAIGARFTSGFLIAPVFIYFWFVDPRMRKGLLLAAAISIPLGLLWFVPSFNWAHHSLSFIRVQAGDASLWTTKLHLLRWGYRNIYFWGLPASVAIAAASFVALRPGSGLYQRRWRGIVLLSIGVIAVHQLLFLQFPIEKSYLLPMLPFVLILLGIGLNGNRMALWAILLTVASYAVIDFNIAKPDHPGFATGGSLGFWVERGELLENLRERWELRHATTFAEYQRVMNGQ